jgi:copper chaperone CopZ
MKVILKLKDMHCTSCSVLIDTVLEEIPGVASAKTSYTDQKTVVEFDESLVQVDKLIEAIKKEGYSASSI